MNIKKIILLIVLSLMLQRLHAAEPIGKVSFVRGSVAAILANKESRLLGKDTPIYQGDNIQTSARSFVIIIFNDGTKITVRPDSSFSINEYSNQQTKQSVKMELHKGGIRANSGEISKDDPTKFQIKTPLTTVNAKQADYSVRLCTNDCEEESKRLKNKKPTKANLVVARVAKIKGNVTAENSKPPAKQRRLVVGSPLYSGDQLSSQKNSSAVIAFRDGERITVEAKTEYVIKQYQYQQENQEDKVIHKLIVGGMRVLTGKIGKVKKENYKINTPVATIGIRGTGFDLYYIDEEGLYSYVWQGTIDQTNEAGDNILTILKSSYIANEHSIMKTLPKLPTKLLQNLPLRPDKISINQEKLFKTNSLKGVPAGLYVTVHDGYVRLGSSELDLGKNETGYVNDNKKIIRLELQLFQEEDPYPLPSNFDPLNAKIGKYSLLVDKYTSSSASTYECVAE
ncbi:MAG: FecR family protein [Methylococcales bacterium]|nr:FecR family protein [Methylococcales bacterium]